jgi:hypothetical protein
MRSKQEALLELEAVIKEFKLNKTDVGLAICGSKSFMNLMRDPKKAITTTTLDRIHHYILEIRGQGTLKL